MISVKVLVGRHRGGALAGPRREATAVPRRALHAAAIALLVLLALAVAIGLFLGLAVVGLVLAVPVLAATWARYLWRGRRRKALRPAR